MAVTSLPTKANLNITTTKGLSLNAKRATTKCATVTKESVPPVAESLFLSLVVGKRHFSMLVPDM